MPEVNERVSHGAPCFFIRDRVALCYFHDNHRGDGRVSLWCAAPPGIQTEMVDSEPDRFFRPVTSASGTFSDWLGVFLDTKGDDRVDWDEISHLLHDAYRAVAPRTLITQLNPARDGSRPQALHRSAGVYQFHSALWRHTGEAAWFFVTLPVDIAGEIEDLTASTRRGFGSVRVKVTIGATTWTTSAFPDNTSRSYVLPVKKSVRTTERLEDGDVVEVALVVVDASSPSD